MADAAPTPLCLRCTGRRLIGALGEDAQREAAAKGEPVAGTVPAAEADCGVCEGAFDDAGEWLRVALAAVAGFEAATFQVGTVFPTQCEQIEKSVPSPPDRTMTDSIRTEANRWLGPRIAEATGMEWVTDGRPELVVMVDTRFWTADVNANSLFVAGRYTKHRRDIPQTHWPCKRCQGKGCWECGDTGVMYAESVEDAIGAHLTPAFGGAKHSFHGAGREDIDALMLGTGRPFVFEVHQPRRRSVDLVAVTAGINAATATTGVALSGLRLTDKEEVARIKAADYEKEYLARCVAEAPVAAADVEAAVQALSGVTLDQRTPDRVSHRRADLVRKRTVQRLAVESPSTGARADATRFALRVLAESGTYIKEFVSGDDGRTVPSFAQKLGVPCRVEFLDVVAIFDGPEERKLVES